MFKATMVSMMACPLEAINPPSKTMARFTQPGRYLQSVALKAAELMALTMAAAEPKAAVNNPANITHSYPDAKRLATPAMMKGMIWLSLAGCAADCTL